MVAQFPVPQGRLRVSDWSKGPTRVDIAQLPVAHAILPDIATSAHVTSDHVNDVTSDQKALLVRLLRIAYVRYGRFRSRDFWVM